MKLEKSWLDYFAACGRIGGVKSASSFTAKQRSIRARKAVQARWAKAKK